MTQAPTVDFDGEPEVDTAQAAEQEAEAVEVRDVELDETAHAPEGRGSGQIELLLDTSVEVSATLGSTRMAVRELLALAPGSVVTLEKMVGDPVELSLNGIPFATGHLVVVGERLGVRLQEILASPSPEDEAG